HRRVCGRTAQKLDSRRCGGLLPTICSSSPAMSSPRKRLVDGAELDVARGLGRPLLPRREAYHLSLTLTTPLFSQCSGGFCQCQPRKGASNRTFLESHSPTSWRLKFNRNRR